MTIARCGASGDLLAGLPPEKAPKRLADGAVLLAGLALSEAKALAGAVDEIAAAAPFRHLVTPGGFLMSVAMTNCGAAGWVSDRAGYRYTTQDPTSGQPWPAMPPVFQSLATRAAAAGGFRGFVPDACLVNRYLPGAKLSLHRDEDERDLSAPVVSVSVGLPAIFLWGGLSRKDRTARLRLESGDVVVWGGPARLVYHGIAPLAEGEHPLTGACRINLTFRQAL
jgi:alkylated DNA repair protein (DNA oxidative demethylase)